MIGRECTGGAAMLDTGRRSPAQRVCCSAESCWEKRWTMPRTCSRSKPALLTMEGARPASWWMPSASRPRAAHETIERCPGDARTLASLGREAAKAASAAGGRVGGAPITTAGGIGRMAGEG